MQYDVPFPSGKGFQPILGTKTLAFFEAAGARLLVKRVANMQAALACGGFLIVCSETNDWAYASGYLAPKLVEQGMVPFAFRLILKPEVADPGGGGLRQRYVPRPHYQFQTHVDGSHWYCYAVITQSYVGFGASGLGDALENAYRDEIRTTATADQGTFDQWQPPQGALTKGRIQLAPIQQHYGLDAYSPLNHGYQYQGMGAGLGVRNTNGELKIPAGTAEIALVDWPKTLKRTWADGRGEILERVSGDGAKYAPEAFEYTLAQLPESIHPYTLCRTGLGGAVYRGRDTDTFSNYDVKVLETESKTVGTDKLGMDDVHYSVVSAIDNNSSRVKMAAQATSNLGVNVPCIHHLVMRKIGSHPSDRAPYPPIPSWQMTYCWEPLPSPSASPLAKFMGVGAGAVLRHHFPSDYFGDDGGPKPEIGQEFTFENAGTATHLCYKFELSEATSWPGIPTDPVERAKAIANNHEQFQIRYTGSKETYENVVTETWVDTIVLALGRAVDVFADKIEEIARRENHG